MQTRRTRRRYLTPVVILLLAALGCGGRETQTETVRMEVRTVWQQPADSEDPLLIFPRDILRLGDRVYVLDGRLAQVAVFDAGTGQPAGEAFGGLGQGPGELGLFPYALVSDGERLGVANLYQVSWFTKDGDFLRRVPLPPVNLGTPSLQYVDGGWLYGAGYQGPDSPLAVLTSPEGDTLGLGSAEAPPEGVSEAVAGQWNAVHTVRLPDGITLLGHEMQNRIQVLDPLGGLLATERWAHLPTDPERTESGRPVGLPGFTFAARLGADGQAYLTDGTLRHVRVYGAAGGLLREIELSGPVFAATWGASGIVYAIDGNDHLQGLYPSVESLRDKTAEPGTATAPESAAALPGTLEAVVPDIPGFFDDHLILRPHRVSHRGDPPTIPRLRNGRAGIYLGYDDGQGVFLPGGIEHLEESIRLAPPLGEGSNTRVVMGDSRPWLLVSEAGLFPLTPGAHPLRWDHPDEFVADALSLPDGSWLLHSLRDGSDEPLLRLAPEGTFIAAGASGRHGPTNPSWTSAWNDWHLLSWGDETVVFDESHVQFAILGEGGLGQWIPVTGSPLRTIAVRGRGLIPDFDMVDVTAIPGQWFLAWNSDFKDGEVINTVWVVAADGKMDAVLRPQLDGLLTSVSVDREGRLLLLTWDALYRWSGWEPGP